MGNAMSCLSGKRQFTGEGLQKLHTFTLISVFFFWGWYFNFFFCVIIGCCASSCSASLLSDLTASWWRNSQDPLPREPCSGRAWAWVRSLLYLFIYLIIYSFIYSVPWIPESCFWLQNPNWQLSTRCNESTQKPQIHFSFLKGRSRGGGHNNNTSAIKYVPLPKHHNPSNRKSKKIYINH